MFDGVSGTWHDDDVLDVYALIERPRWHLLASCRGVGGDLFFPERGESLAPARALCAVCPVRGACSEAGLGEKWGVWGGLSERERRRVRQRRSAA